MATNDYEYPRAGTLSFTDRDAEPVGSPDKQLRGLWHHNELVLIKSAMDDQVNTNNPVFVGTLSSGAIDGGTY